MNNLIAFINSFLSYLLVSGVFAVCIVASCFAGISLRKIRNKKAENTDHESIE